LLFAGYHLQQAETIPSLVPVGISLGLLRWWRGSVWTAALVHYLGNAAFFTTTYILTPRAPTFRTGTV
jgi:membrane protease YdiL (CAAX protease family)